MILKTCEKCYQLEQCTYEPRRGSWYCVHCLDREIYGSVVTGEDQNSRDIGDV